MLEKEKLWLAVYINVKGIATEDINCIISSVMDNMRFDESVRTIVIPIMNDETHIECIYDPTGNSGEKYQEFFEKANRYIEEFNEKYKNK